MKPRGVIILSEKNTNAKKLCKSFPFEKRKKRNLLKAKFPTLHSVQMDMF